MKRDLDAGTVRAETISRVRGLVADLPRSEFGEGTALAVTAAYQKIDALLVDELRRVVAE